MFDLSISAWGHRVSLESAIKIVLECTPQYRIPEPLRHVRMLNKHG
jgi:deoxyinosine 3'endonuclease (endonuclease V)